MNGEHPRVEGIIDRRIYQALRCLSSVSSPKDIERSI